MRGITITYKYDGPEEAWRDLTGAFIAAIDADPAVAGKFTYQVMTADDGITRVHWGRWDSDETLKSDAGAGLLQDIRRRAQVSLPAARRTRSPPTWRTGRAAGSATKVRDGFAAFRNRGSPSFGCIRPATARHRGKAACTGSEDAGDRRDEKHHPCHARRDDTRDVAEA